MQHPAQPTLCCFCNGELLKSLLALATCTVASARFTMRIYSLPLRYVLLLLLLVGSADLRAQSPTEITWLNQHLSPIQHLEPSPDFADLQPLAPLVAGATVVGLGEATHGSREFFLLKHRLVEYLVTQQGFTTFAIEADY
ncbi:MAG: hypothetical protein EOO61_13005, partial [Hymenobacter sp.]